MDGKGLQGSLVQKRRKGKGGCFGIIGGRETFRNVGRSVWRAKIDPNTIGCKGKKRGVRPGFTVSDKNKAPAQRKVGGRLQEGRWGERRGK